MRIRTNGAALNHSLTKFQARQAFMCFLTAIVALLLCMPSPAFCDVSPEAKEALEAHKAGKLKEAVEVYTEAIEKHPNSAEAYNWRGMAYDDLGDLDKALKDFNKAIELSPNYADAYNNRGEVYRKKKMYAQATADYRKALSLDKNFAESVYNMGLIHEAQQRKAQAAQEFENYLKIKPNDPDKEQIAQKIQQLKREAAQAPAPPAVAPPGAPAAPPPMVQAPAAPAPGAPPAPPAPPKAAPPPPGAPAAPGPLPPGFTPPGAKPGAPPSPPFAMPGMPGMPGTPKPQPGLDLGIPGMPPIPSDLGSVMAAMDIFSTILSLAFYLFFSVMLFLIAKKTNTSLPWLAFIPVASMILMVQIAKKPLWWLALLLLMFLAPFAMVLAVVDPTGGTIAMILMIVLVLISLAAWLMVDMGIAQARGKSALWGVLLFIPCTTPIAYVYLGLSK